MSCGHRHTSLLVIAMVVLGAMRLPAQSSFSYDPFVRGAQAIRERNFQEAVRIYQEVLDGNSNPTWKVGAKLELGKSYEAWAKYDEAIAILQQIVNQETTCQHDAQWEIGNCLFKQNKYEEAMAAYQETLHKYPYRSFCGNAHAQFRYRYAFQKGLCQEWLGRTADAMKSYLQADIQSWGLYTNATADLRIVKTYESLEKRGALKSLLVQWERDWKEKLSKSLKRELTAADDSDWIHNWFPGRRILTILQIHDKAAQGQWESLIDRLRSKTTQLGPETSDWTEMRESARFLSTVPSETVPLLINRLKTSDDDVSARWICFTLGLCGSPEALSALKTKLLTKGDPSFTFSLICSISQSVEGKAVIVELQKSPSPELKAVLDAYERNVDTRLKDKETIAYPALSKDASVPTTWTEADPER